jgi:AcrR family transcriptional regulator
MAQPTSTTDRREQLVQAAITVLRERGVAACTARTVAAASPLTKSSLHYYFDDVDEVVDIAMARLMQDFIGRIQTAASAAADPVTALWSAAETYLRLGGSHPGRIPLLWFEYQVVAVRSGRTATVREITEQGAVVWEQLVAATGVDRAVGKSRALYAALIGSVVEQSLDPRPVPDVLEEIAAAFALPAPSDLGTAS